MKVVTCRHSASGIVVPRVRASWYPSSCGTSGMNPPSCHWEAYEPWQKTKGEPSCIRREVKGSSEHAAARGVETLHKGDHAVEITYRVFDGAWGQLVGVTDADAEFDTHQQKGGRAWGFDVLGCGFVATRNAFRRDGQEGGRDVARSLNFDQQFTTSQGLVPSLHVKSRDLVKKVEGFRIAVHVDWPRRQLYFSIAGGACRSNPHPNPHPNPQPNSNLGPNPNLRPNPNPDPKQVGPTVSRQSCCRTTCRACGRGYKLTASTPQSSCRPL